MNHTRSRQIPLAFALLPAGNAVEVCDDGYGMLDVNFLICGDRECFAFVVTGDSMRDDIQHGNIVFIDPNVEPKNGDTVAVSINGANCIKIFERTDRRLYLVPKNGDFPTCEVRPSDIFHVLGVVKAHLAMHG
jgi:SOS-response transcriptional repressor LexA